VCFRGVKNLGFIRVASAKALTVGKMTGAEANGKPILVADVDGKYYAIGDKCTHRGCKLSGGTLKENGIVQCPCHGSNFDVKTGNVVKGPAKTPELTYRVKVEKDDILVDI
jgi:3-phenylpropionate/trans-cinnamate dioxygenase ferredoxin subunit